MVTDPIFPDFSTAFLSPLGPVDVTYNTTANTITSLPSLDPYPFATSTATTSLYTLSNSTTTSYTIYTPFEGYEYDTRGTNTTTFTLNGTLVGTYTYDRNNEAEGKLTYTFTNYLGTPVLSTDEKGDIVETFITDVFGNLYYRDARNDNAFHNKGYTSHVYDTESGLTYAHARYLDTKVHSFLSVDPLQYSLTKESLYDPQSLNGYAYARNNPVLFKDPDGKYAVVDDAAAIVIGGVVGIGMYSASTYLSGDKFSTGGFVGSAVTGAIGGEAALYAPATGGASIAFAMGAGGLASSAGNITQQWTDKMLGNQDSIDWENVGETAITGSITSGIAQGLVKNVKISKITSGRSNWNSIRSGMITKLKNKSIESVSVMTASKMAVAQQVTDSARTGVYSMLEKFIQSLSAFVKDQKKISKPLN